MARNDGRLESQMRPVTIERNTLWTCPGSCQIRFGRTRVLTTARFSDSVPPFLEGKGTGWLTAEYAMMPGSTPKNRKSRGSDGRSTEIQRLIGRSLRAVVDLSKFGPMTLQVDTDVIEADGGTRTAAITGAFIAVIDAIAAQFGPSAIERIVTDSISAISVGVVDGIALADLDYSEDVRAEVDFNLVRLGRNGFVEVQGTGEKNSFDRAALNQMLDIGELCLNHLKIKQKEALGELWKFD
ncbi:MAG: ribonuclease PH [Planctomycetota bacterium]|nr:ribonuclease PH [Planctomycetota bacterium]